MQRIVLAYTGEAAATAAIPWLAQQLGAEVVTLTLDLGQGGELLGIRERALAAGAVRAHVLDVREAFALEYIWPAVQAGVPPVSAAATASALGRYLIARTLVEVARIEGATAVAHGGEASSLLEAALAALDASLAILHTPAPDSCSVQATLWGRYADVAAAGTHDAYALTRPRAACPAYAALVSIDFEAGVPIRANGIEMSLVDLVESVETIAGAHGVGRVEDRSASGGRRIAESPAAVVLTEAYRQLDARITPPEAGALRPQIAAVYQSLIENGGWLSPAREAIDAFVRVLQPRVNGSVRMRLLNGECVAVETVPRVDAPHAAAPAGR